MEKWEYLTEFIRANIENEGVKAFLQEKYTNWKNPPKYAPQTMIPYLNKRGEQGWELIHIEPVRIGDNYDISLDFQGGAHGNYTNIYFSVFKRRKQE